MSGSVHMVVARAGDGAWFPTNWQYGLIKKRIFWSKTKFQSHTGYFLGSLAKSFNFTTVLVFPHLLSRNSSCMYVQTEFVQGKHSTQ